MKRITTFFLAISVMISLSAFSASAFILPDKSNGTATGLSQANPIDSPRADDNAVSKEKTLALPVETRIKIGEERQVFNKNTEAGIVRRYYVDPSQHNGVGSIMSVFYKNGTEEMFWKGWNLYTDKGMYAVKFKDSFYVEPRPGPMTADMITLRTMVTEFKNQGYIDPVDVNFFKLCLMDENHGVLKTANGEEVCAKADFTK